MTTRPSRCYLDTCIVSAIAKEDLPSERAAVAELLRLHKEGVLQLVTSDITKTEIEKIPQPYRYKHEAIYNLLASVSAFVPMTPLDLIGLTASGYQFRLQQLQWLLPDRLDAHHVFAVWIHGLDYFVTTDEKTILRYRFELERDFNVKAVLPSELVEFLRV